MPSVYLPTAGISARSFMTDIWRYSLNGSYLCVNVDRQTMLPLPDDEVRKWYCRDTNRELTMQSAIVSANWVRARNLNTRLWERRTWHGVPRDGAGVGARGAVFSLSKIISRSLGLQPQKLQVLSNCCRPRWATPTFQPNLIRPYNDIYITKVILYIYIYIYNNRGVTGIPYSRH